MAPIHRILPATWIKWRSQLMLALGASEGLQVNATTTAAAIAQRAVDGASLLSGPVLAQRPPAPADKPIPHSEPIKAGWLIPRTGSPRTSEQPPARLLSSCQIHSLLLPMTVSMEAAAAAAEGHFHSREPLYRNGSSGRRNKSPAIVLLSQNHATPQQIGSV